MFWPENSECVDLRRERRQIMAIDEKPVNAATDEKSINKEINLVEVPEIKTREGDIIIALSGQQNTGKTTLFNALTGMHQHTGNWPGLTVDTANGHFEHKGQGYTIVDLPGTYSLLTSSHEETIAASFVISGKAACTVVVCDATQLERNLVLPLQIMELTDNVIIAVNLMDEAQKHGVSVDFERMEKELNVPVVGVAAGPGWGMDKLQDRIEDVVRGRVKPHPQRVICNGIDDAVDRVICLRGTDQEDADKKAAILVKRAESIAAVTVHKSGETAAAKRQKALDNVIMGRGGIPVALLLLFGVFWLTIQGANYPSDALAWLFDWLGDKLWVLAESAALPAWASGILLDGIYSVSTTVISVMLPPMAIFFPCFTLLEDFGYLPRVAFRLDHSFQSCGACGKQSLTMCMAFGCTAAGVTGCRIIDSPRERLMAILTNVLVPCNGRFPTLIMIITIFFSAGGFFGAVTSAAMLTMMVVIGIIFTFIMCKFLNMTILKGQPSSFVLEIPPYRKPQIGQVIVRSVVDRTLKVLWRAVYVAAPAGVIIWLLANVSLGDISIIQHFVNFMNPLGVIMGLDGVILVAYICGFPANEIVMPIAIMILTASGSLGDADNIVEVGNLLISAGWTWKTALCTLVFCLFHWPCATTILTIRKETDSWKWAGISFILPTMLGIGCCIILNAVLMLF